MQALRVNINNPEINNISEWCLINAVRKENFTFKSTSAEPLVLSLGVASAPFSEINTGRGSSVNWVSCQAKSNLKKVLNQSLRDLIQHWRFKGVCNSPPITVRLSTNERGSMNVAPPPGESEAHLSQTSWPNGVILHRVHYSADHSQRTRPAGVSLLHVAWVRGAERDVWGRTPSVAISMSCRCHDRWATPQSMSHAGLPGLPERRQVDIRLEREKQMCDALLALLVTCRQQVTVTFVLRTPSDETSVLGFFLWEKISSVDHSELVLLSSSWALYQIIFSAPLKADLRHSFLCTLLPSQCKTSFNLVFLWSMWVSHAYCRTSCLLLSDILTN